MDQTAPMDDNVWIARATAGFAAIVGLAVAVGWLAGLPYLPQPLASCRPMHFNSAVITLLLALGLLALSAGRARLAAVCAACGGAIAGLTILEWLSGLDLRIDQLVVRDLIRFEDGTPPGRPSAPFLGSVLLAATSLFLIARQRAGRASVVAALACGTSGVLLLLTHLALAANPVDDTRHFVSPQAAACLCALSYGLLAAGEAARYGRRGPTVQAFPAAAAIFGILLSCVLWTQLRHKEQRELFASLRREEQIVAVALSDRLSLYASTLQGLAYRIEKYGPEPEDQWAIESALLLRSLPILQGIGFVSPELTVRWVQPLRSFESAIGKSLGSQPARRAAFERARATGAPAATRILPLLGGRMGFVLVLPVGTGRQFLGYLIACFPIDSFVDITLRHYGSRSTLCLFDGGRLVHSTGDMDAGSLPTADAATVRVLGTNWWVTMSCRTLHRPGELDPLDEVFLVAGIAVSISFGLTLLWLFHSRETSARLETEIRMRRKTELDLKRSNEDLEQFAYTASHDLREPLRAVTSYLELLERRYRDALDAKAHKYVGYAVDGAKRMETLICDLLAYSRAGREQATAEKVDCAEALREAQKNLSRAIEASGAVIDAPGLPSVPGNHRQLQQLFQNLIDNAIKFRSAQPPVIRIRAEPAAGGWLFQVADNGVGISPESRDGVFKLFHRGHATTHVPGSGIGLAIAKKIVERHGGKIWVESEPQHGARFFFTLAGESAREGLSKL